MNTEPQPLNDQVKRASSVVILLPKHPTYEQVACGLGVFLTLQESGRRTDVVCPSPMLVEFNHLVGVQRVKTELTGKNLVISFDYVKDAIEKVSYNVDGGKFNLVVIPKTGHDPLDPTSVTYQQTGIDAELVLAVGMGDSDGVKSAFPDLSSQEILPLTPSPDRSLASAAAQLLSGAGLTPDEDAASNLFAGLVRGTSNFTVASALDFEVAAALVRAGASLTLPVSQRTAGEEISVEPSQPEEKTDWLKPRIYSSRDRG